MDRIRTAQYARKTVMFCAQTLELLSVVFVPL